MQEQNRKEGFPDAVWAASYMMVKVPGKGYPHREGELGRENAHITNSVFTAPTVSGPSSVTHFLEPSMRGSNGMPRPARMNLRMLK